jgi:2,3-bisphosphoglycerate-independent phosphoglycerate mutase
MKKRTRPIILLICDGLGHRVNDEYNAVAVAAKQNFSKFWEQYPHALLSASGQEVGLPPGQMGTSEANHLIIGSGRIVYQNLAKINLAIFDKSLGQNSVLLKAFEHVKKNKSTLHLFGLIGPGGVHSHSAHFKFIVEEAKKAGINNIILQILTDGRDTPPRSALEHVKDLEDFLAKIDLGKIASLGGRYWGMDRDNNWERIEKHFQVLLGKSGEVFENASEIINQSYQRGKDDEFIEPARVKGGKEIGENDAVIFMNFRSDRAKQITKRFIDEKIKNLCFIMMTQYAEDLDLPVLFPPEKIKNTLSEIISKNGFRQLRLTETEKFTHLTFFFNAQRYKEDKGEDRIMIPSNKDVKYHDGKPEMKALEIAKKIEEILPENKYQFIAINLVNCDIVGHTGNWPAILKAVGYVDQAMGLIVKTAQKNNVDVILTADHGNAERTFDKKSNQPMTAHTLSPVPFILISDKYKKINRSIGLLNDIAPTILTMLDLKIPKEMTGKSFV